MERRGGREGEEEDHLVWVDGIAGVRGGEAGRKGWPAFVDPANNWGLAQQMLGEKRRRQ